MAMPTMLVAVGTIRRHYLLRRKPLQILDSRLAPRRLSGRDGICCLVVDAVFPHERVRLSARRRVSFGDRGDASVVALARGSPEPSGLGPVG